MYIANSKLAVGVSVGGCLTLCPAMNWQRVHVEPPSSSNDFWDRIQLPRDPGCRSSGDRNRADFNNLQQKGLVSASC